MFGLYSVITRQLEDIKRGNMDNDIIAERGVEVEAVVTAYREWEEYHEGDEDNDPYYTHEHKSDIQYEYNGETFTKTNTYYGSHEGDTVKLILDSDNPSHILDSYNGALSNVENKGDNYWMQGQFNKITLVPFIMFLFVSLIFVGLSIKCIKGTLNPNNFK